MNWNEDPRYDSYPCPGCGASFQLIDWRSALHRLVHAGEEIPSPPAVIQCRVGRDPKGLPNTGSGGFALPDHD